MDKFKSICKYVMNGLAVLDALIVGLDPIWNIPYGEQISATLTVIVGVIGTYLLGNKAISSLSSSDEEEE